MLEIFYRLIVWYIVASVNADMKGGFQGEKLDNGTQAFNSQSS